MNNSDLEFLAIDAVGDVITNEDAPDVPSSYALNIRGSRQSKVSMVFEGDYGTKNVFPSLPAVPEAGTVVGGYRFYDKSNQTEYHVVITYNASSGYTRVYVNDSNYSGSWDTGSWIELTRVLSAVVDGTPSTTTTSVNIKTIKDSLLAAYGLEANEAAYWTCYNKTQNKAFTVISNTTTSLTGDGVYLGSDGLGFADGDQLYLIRHNWTLVSIYSGLTATPTASLENLSLGATPHNRGLAIEAQQKINLLLGTSATPPVMQLPMAIQRKAARGMFYDNSTPTPSALITYPAGWYAEQGLNLCTFYQTKGSPSSCVSSATSASDTVSVTDGAGVFMTMVVSYGDDTTLQMNSNLIRVWMTLLYGYQESDPFYKIYVVSSTTSKSPFVYPQFWVNPARMSKNLTGVRMYAALLTKEQQAAGWLDSDSSYFFMKDIYFNLDDKSRNNYDFSSDSAAAGGWVRGLINATDCDYNFVFTTASDGYINPNLINSSISRGANTLYANLQHQSSIARTQNKPRFIQQISSSQGSGIVIDQDDSTLRRSSYDGFGVHEDDNFPMASADKSGNRLRINLRGRGPLRGLGIAHDTIYALRESDIDVADLQSANQGIITSDFIAPLSLVRHDYGLTWAGKSGVCWLSESGGGIRVINPLWQNKYDGSMLIDDGSAQYVTDAYRAAIISGYDPYYRSVWFHIQMNKDTADGGGSEYICARYYFESQRWDFRKLNIGSSSPVVYFGQTYGGTNGSTADQSEKGRLILGYSGGILEYPYIGTYKYQDDVTSAQVSQSKGIERDIFINIKELHNQAENTILKTFLIEHKGNSTSGAGLATIRIYANQETTPFDTQYVRVDEIGEMRKCEERGALSALKFRITFPTASLNDFNRYEVSRIVLGFTKQPRSGSL